MVEIAKIIKMFTSLGTIATFEIPAQYQAD